MWGTKQQRFLTMHYAGWVYLSLWIHTKGCSQLSETEKGITSAEPGDPKGMEITLHVRDSAPASWVSQAAGPLIFQPALLLNLLCQITVLLTACPSLRVQSHYPESFLPPGFPAWLGITSRTCELLRACKYFAPCSQFSPEPALNK